MTSNFSKYFKVFSESKYILLLNIIDRAFSFGFMLMLARHFSTDTYGTIVTLITLTTVFITIFDLGLPIYLQRAISVDANDATGIFSKIFSISLVLFVLYFLLGFGVLKLLYPEISVILFAVITVMMYCSSLVTTCNKALSGVNDFKSQFIAFFIPRVLIIAGFAAGIYYYSFSADELMLLMLMGFTINLLWVFVYLKKNNIRFSFKHFSINHINTILKLSLPLGLAVIFNFLYDKIDVLLISELSGFTNAAYYNVGYGLFKAGTLSFSFLLVSGFTKVSSFNRNKVDVTMFYNEYFRVILVICIIVGAILFFTAEPLVKILYTTKFADSAAVLKVLSFGLIAVGLNNLTGTVINAMGFYKIVMYITLYGLILNVVLNIIFIPRYGLMAPSVITLITEYFILVMEILYLRKILKA